MIKSQKEYLERIEYLNTLSHHYYNLDDPIVSDAIYDELYQELKAYEEKTLIAFKLILLPKKWGLLPPIRSIKTPI